MAHRGRLNVLVNLLGKSPAELFSEFEGSYDPSRLRGSGDVKYHQGFSRGPAHAGGKRAHRRSPSTPRTSRSSIPSSRARCARARSAAATRARDRSWPLLIHGDAAFAGQGVVMETLQLSQTRGFFTGGTVHIVINNQIGFTTSEPADARSTIYCTDVAKMIEVPIFHVNGDDPEAVVLRDAPGVGVPACTSARTS